MRSHSDSNRVVALQEWELNRSLVRSGSYQLALRMFMKLGPSLRGVIVESDTNWFVVDTHAPIVEGCEHTPAIRALASFVA